MSEDVVLAVLGIAIGGFALWAGIRFRAGGMRHIGRWYLNPFNPTPMRNAAFIFIPGGTYFVVSGAVIAIGQFRGHLVADVLLAILAIAWFVSIALTFLWSFRPPEWLKPEWLRARENGGDPG